MSINHKKKFKYLVRYRDQTNGTTRTTTFSTTQKVFSHGTFIKFKNHLEKNGNCNDGLEIKVFIEDFKLLI